MDINEIEAGWGEFVFVWVRPSNGRSWYDFSNGAYGEVGEHGWRPAMVTGFLNADEREFYGTNNDPRRVTLLGKPYGYKVSDFDFQEMEPAQHTELALSQDKTISFRAPA